MFDVVSIGSATLDVFLRSRGLRKKENGALEICVPYGAKVEVEEIEFESGGGGTNSAVTFARQGLKTASIVKIGNDFAGKKVRQDLEKEGVNTSLIVEEKGDTDYSTILWTADGGRTVLVYRGKTRLEVKDIDWGKIKTKWFYISSVEGNLKIVSQISNVKIAWNPGGRELGQRKKVLELLPRIELLNLNKEEMEELLGIRKNWKLETKELLKKAQGLPCRWVVITDERNGSFFWDGRGWLWAGIYEDAPRIETTGAGDAFGSGLVAALVKGFSLKDSLRVATANASSVVGQIGAKKGILRKKDWEKWKDKPLRMEEVKVD